jgi:Transglycosylase SLT domain
VPATVTGPSGSLSLGAVAGGTLLLLVAAVTAILSALVGASTCSGGPTAATPSAHAEQGIPVRYLTLYRATGDRYAVPWPVLAAIGSIETDHGRLRAPGVRSGVNRYGCCGGPMQFNLRDGPPSTWERYGVDGNRDGTRDVYDPADAIASAASYLRMLLQNADGNLPRAVFGYNHSQAYVDDVLARARGYANASDGELAAAADPDLMAACGKLPAGPANLGEANRVSSPRAFRTLPTWAPAAGSGPAAIDARIHDDVVWILRRYRLRVTAAREAGHRTHGDGTALDLVPTDGTAQAVWDASAGRLARDLGWTPACAHSGSRPACPLAPAIQFVGYDGYPRHGSPRTCGGTCRAHIRVSWVSPCYGTSGLSPPCEWVMSFPAPAAGDPTPTALSSESGPQHHARPTRTWSLLPMSGHARVPGADDRVSSNAGAWRTSGRTLASEVKPSVLLSAQSEIGVCPRPSPFQADLVAALSEAGRASDRRGPVALPHALGLVPAALRPARRPGAGGSPARRRRLAGTGSSCGTTCAGGSRLSRWPTRGSRWRRSPPRPRACGWGRW